MRADPPLAVIELSGELDIARKEELHRALALDPGLRAVLLDLSGVTYADSTALTELLRFRKQTDENGISVAMVVTSPQFDRIIRYAGLYEVFSIFADRSSATAFLERAQ
ncbi:MAG: STAS domain-containing protein [Candidatus Eremiobacteraeota bacterium]|nr:STAS domain-containing protein [Candidatus Eremiobacteraeota bacterium]MBV8371763.1 STAS domain-containing protein [Candidatus Eremiobacteraeota bacterium]